MFIYVYIIDKSIIICIMMGCPNPLQMSFMRQPVVIRGLALCYWHGRHLYEKHDILYAKDRQLNGKDKDNVCCAVDTNRLRL